MTGLFSSVLRMSILASGAAMIIILVRLCLRRAPKIFSYALWSVMLFRLLCPFAIGIPVDWLPPLDVAGSSSPVYEATGEQKDALPEHYSNEESAQSTTAQGIPPSIEPETGGIYTGIAEQTPPMSGAASATAAPKSESALQSALPTLCSIWLAGIGVMIVYAVFSTAILRRKLCTAFVMQGNIYESDRINTAFVLGLFRPRIYLPCGLSDERARSVILHEQTHLRRGDNIIKIVSFAALMIHWFNPICWLSFLLMCRDMERSCDEAVVRSLCKSGGSIEQVKRSYGMALFSLADVDKLYLPVAFSEVSTKERVDNVMKYKSVKRSAIIVISLLLVVVAALCLIDPFSADADDGKAEAVISDNVSINKSSDVETITINGMVFRSDVTTLDLSYKDVTDISPLKGCTSLRELDLEGNPSIADLSAICSLSSLERLELSYCGIDMDAIRQMRFFEGLTNLRYLGLKGAEADVELSSIGSLEHLTALSVSIDSQHDLNALARLENVEELSIIWDMETSSFDEDGRSFDPVDYSSLEAMKGLRSLHILSRWNVTAEMIKTLAKIDTLRSLNIEGVPAYAQAYDVLSDLKQLDELHIELTQEIASLSFLDELKSLKALYVLGALNTVDISPLGKLADIETLALRGMLIPDAAAIESLGALAYIDLSGCDITGFERIKWPTGITHLGLLGTGTGGEQRYEFCIDDISFVRSLPKLRYLEFGPSTGFSDISALEGLRELEYLNISGMTSISDISPLYACKKLTMLSIQGTFSDLSPLRDCVEMRYISLAGRFDDISVFEHFRAIEQLSLSGRFSDIHALEGCKSLTRLRLEGGFDDVSVISGMTKLQSLDLGSEHLSDLSPLDALGRLRELYLTDAPADDIAFISDMQELERLSLLNTGVKDITSLYGLENIRWLRYYGDGVSPAQIAEFARSHPECALETDEVIG